jgi:hypothetical protein
VKDSGRLWVGVMVVEFEVFLKDKRGRRKFWEEVKRKLGRSLDGNRRISKARNVPGSYQSRGRPQCLMSQGELTEQIHS